MSPVLVHGQSDSPQQLEPEKPFQAQAFDWMVDKVRAFFEYSETQGEILLSMYWTSLVSYCRQKVIVLIFFSFQNKTNGNAKLFELISPDEAKYNGSDPFIKDEASSYDYEPVNWKTNPKMVDFDSVGGKRAKYTHPIVYDSTDHMNDSSQTLSNSNDIDVLHASGGMRMDNKDEVAKDEVTIFGEFIVSELRNLKTEQFRRKFKLMVQKSLVEVMEEEEAMLANRDE